MLRTRIVAIAILLLGIISGFIAYPRLGAKLPFALPNIPFRLGLDLAGGTHLVYQSDLNEIPEGDRGSAMSGVRDVVERRVNLFGVSEPVVEVAGQDRLVVELAGITNVADAIKLIGETPFLEFREERTPQERLLVLEQIVGAEATEKLKDTVCASGEEFIQFLLQGVDPCFKPTGLSGKQLKRAQLVFSSTGLEPVVSLEFNDEGTKLFAELTERNVGRKLAIYLDGLPISSPVVRERIPSGRAEISGRFTPQEAKTLVERLNAGALPVPIKLISQTTVGAALGKESLERSLQAGLYGVMAVSAFMLLWYRLPGFVAVCALLIYTGMLLSIFKLIPVTLTLAGITGFILSLGMAVDANILIFERTKEELRAGLRIREAVEEGFRRAWLSIRDSNVSSILSAAILWWMGTSLIQGFALTLGVGVLLSMFSAIFVTRTFLRATIGGWTESAKWLFKPGLDI